MDTVGWGREVVAVALGGAVGSVARYAVALAITRIPNGFPWGILVANVAGCFLIGAIGQWCDLAAVVPAWLRPLVITGFLGGLTTFSSFGYDTLRLIHAGEHAAAAGNVVANLLLGLGAVWLGMLVVRGLGT